MDPLMHLLLPLLFLLALRVDTRKAVLLAPLAVLPDLDALFGLHRALGHSFVPVLVIPMAILAYAKFKKPEWMLAAVLTQFYLASHVVLDLGEVAFLWPIMREQLDLDLGVTLAEEDGFHIDLIVKWETKELADLGTTYILSEFGFALIFLAALSAVVFRREFAAALSRLRSVLASLPGLLQR